MIICQLILSLKKSISYNSHVHIILILSKLYILTRSIIFFYHYSKIVELEEELRVVGNNLKSLEVSEEKVN